MTATKTNERPGTRAVHRYCGMSASKARQVLDLIRGQEVQRAAEILSGVEREAAEVIGKVLTSAVANAAHNDQQNPEDLYVSACYADEGATMKRWRPRARGRATRIRKRTCHITVIVSRLPADSSSCAAGAWRRSAPTARSGSPPRGAGRPDRSPVAPAGRPGRGRGGSRRGGGRRSGGSRGGSKRPPTQVETTEVDGCGRGGRGRHGRQRGGGDRRRRERGGREHRWRQRGREG